MAITAATRRELIAVVASRYRNAATRDRSRIPDEFVEVTGFHRKHAIRVLNANAAVRPIDVRTPRRRPRLYDEAVRQAVVVLWEASDRICGERLRPLIPTLVPALEKHGHLQLEKVVRARVLAASASTLDRLLREPRTVRGGRDAARPPL